MGWIWDSLSSLPTDIKESVAFPPQASSSGAVSGDGPFQFRQINNHVYEIGVPSKAWPSLELVFFHGLQLTESQESQQAYKDTWRSKDGKELWLTWILDEFPEARILTVSYDAHAEKTEKDGRMDMYVTTENLVQDLTDARVGQNKCPVVLVGHCIGGLVMKQLCVSAATSMAMTPKKRTKKFLDSIKGFFFYATPHFGTNLAENTDFTKGCLFENAETLHTEAARQREQFCALRKSNDWKTYGMVESDEVTLGKFKGLVVPEASARCDMDAFYTGKANHFYICRPTNQNSSSFEKLIIFIKDLVKQAGGKIHNEQRTQLCEELPTNPVGLEKRALQVQELLKGGAVLGIFGMGGIGKTTLAREVFNNISKYFKYTCFIDDVKGYSISELRKSILEHFYHKGNKLDAANREWSQIKRKKTLIVMDDTDSVSQLAVLPRWQEFKDGSCLIITSRFKGVFRRYGNCIVHDVEFLETNEAFKLFCKHAFGSEDIPSDKPEHFRQTVNAVVEKCCGLPLTLEVMGRYLGNVPSITAWEETIDNLKNAKSIDGGKIEDDEVWATLEVSYKRLSQEAQDMFCEAATFFFQEPLDTALAAWSDRNGETAWINLVNRAMVKEVAMKRSSTILSKFVEYKGVWVHEQLRDLAKNLTKNAVLSCTHEGLSSLVDQLNTKQVNVNTKSLRLQYGGASSGILQPTLQVDSLVRLEELRYIAIFGVLHEGEGKGLTRKLRLLRWDSCTDGVRPSFQISLTNMNELAVLQLADCVMPRDFPKTLGNLVKLRILELSYCDVPEGFHEALGNLQNLHILSLTDLSERKQSLPESFGSLSKLKRLELVKLKSSTLPKSFGQLSSLQELVIDSPELQTLPSSFGALKLVQKVELECPKLQRLPNGFAGLSSLTELRLYCRKLKSLPGDFGALSSLEELTIYCPELKSLSDDFGQLATLEDLHVVSNELETLPEGFGNLKALLKANLVCCKLNTLPESFGHLSALQYLRFQDCHKLHALPDSFGDLSALRELKLIACEELESLPGSFGQLAKLQHLEITVEAGSHFIGRIHNLPDSFANLMALRHLVLDRISLQRIPDSIKNLMSLHSLELGQLPYVKDLPPWLGETGMTPVALSRKIFQVRDEKFSLTREDDPSWAEAGISVEGRSERLFWMLYKSATKRVSVSDYEGALAILGLDNSGLLLRPWLQGFMLQETGVIKRMNGDLTGALKNLTAALDIFSEGDDLRCYAYHCWKHRGFVNFLRDKFDEARKDGEMALSLRSQYRRYPADFRGEKLGEKPVEYMEFTLK
ncbi:unnamed protein product [Calypogeia fissa]